MSIPTFQEVMRPWLELASDGREHALQEVIGSLADKSMLSPEERAEMLPSGFQGTFTNRVAWAATHLQKARALERVGRGRYRITERGKALLAEQGPVTTARLMQFAEYQEFKARGKESAPSTTALEDTTPAEAIDSAIQAVRGAVATELLDRIKASPPDFFERLVVDLLLKMGYGGSRRDAGQAVGKSGDGGIDGVIKEDRLGLDAVYIQAKRWEGSVGAPVVREFAGTLDFHKANKGVLITTSTFTSDAKVFTQSIGKRIVLIDGVLLAELMIDNEVGVITESTYRLVRVDQGFFEPE
ncbi:MAG: restriction endonuclease [Candidatus Limnocylindrales bacterium]